MNRFGSSCPRRRASLRFFTADKSKSDSRLRGSLLTALAAVYDSKTRMRLLFLILLLIAGSAFAQPAKPDAPLQFQNTTEEARFHALASELRCVMCQNQSLADSNAQIARDLRGEILQLMRQGKSDHEIENYLVARYGEFVLYKPRVEANTWLLWFGPALVLLAGGLVVIGIVRRRSRNADTVADDDRQEW